MQKLFRPPWATRQAAELGAKFRALPEHEQRAHAKRAWDRSVEVLVGKNRRRGFSVLVDPSEVPGLEYHRKGHGSITAAFYDEAEAIDWIVQVYARGFSVFFMNGGLGHPLAERGFSQ